MAQFSRLTTEIDAILDDVEAAKEPYASLAARLYAIINRFGGMALAKMTQEQYDDLEEKDESTAYYVVSDAGESAALYLGEIGIQGGGSYVLPKATASSLGGVKVGTGLTIDSSGVLSATGGVQPTQDEGKVLLYSIESNAASEIYTATEACDVIALNFDVNGEASDESLGSDISTTGTVNGTYTDSAAHSGLTDRNYSLTVKSISLQSGQEITFSHGSSHTGSYTAQIHLVLLASKAYTTISSIYFSSKADSGITQAETIASDSDYIAFSIQTKGSDASRYSGTLSTINVAEAAYSDISTNGGAAITRTNKAVAFLGSISAGWSVIFSAQASSGYVSQSAMLLSLS